MMSLDDVYFNWGYIMSKEFQRQKIRNLIHNLEMAIYTDDKTCSERHWGTVDEAHTALLDELDKLIDNIKE